MLGIWLFDAITLVGSIAFGQTAMGRGDAKLAAMMGAEIWSLLAYAGFIHMEGAWNRIKMGSDAQSELT